MAKVKDMTKGSPTKLIVLFSLPLMVGNMFQQLYMIVDAMVVGQGVGVSALAAVGATDWIYWMFLWMVMGFTQGFSVLIAQSFGSGDYNKLKKYVASSISLSLFFAAIMTAIGFIVAKPMLLVLNTPSHIIEQSQIYLYILIGGMIVMAAYNMASSILRALGDGRTPLIAMVTAGIINIILDLLFVLVFKWGIAGAAIATIIAQLFSAVYCFVVISRLKILKLCLSDFKSSKETYISLCKIGIPIGLQNAIIAVGGMAVQYVLNGFGTVYIAGFTATNKLFGLLESTAISFGFAMNTYMGQNMGAKNAHRLKKGMRSVLILSVVISIIIGIIMIIFGKPLLSLFISASEKNAAAVLEVAYRYLFIMACALLPLYLLHAYRSSLQGLGNAKVPMFSGGIEFIMRVSVALLLPGMVGEIGIFFCEPAAWIGAAIFLLISYYVYFNSVTATFCDNNV